MTQAELFERYAFQVVAVACPPPCGAKPGARCKRPSEHTTGTPHAARKRLADEKFIELYGKRAGIYFDEMANKWGVKDSPKGRFIAHAEKTGRKANGK